MFVISKKTSTGLVYWGERGPGVSAWGDREGAKTFATLREASRRALGISVLADAVPA